MTTVALAKTISHDGKDYQTAEIDEPTVGGIEAFEGAKAAGETDTAATIKMLVYELGWPIEVVRKIRSSDFVKISDALAPFVAAAGATGD
jgi:hypothetical protein